MVATSNSSLTASDYAAQLDTVADEIQQLKDWIYDLEMKRKRLRAEQERAERIAKGWFHLYDYTAQYHFRDTYDANKSIECGVKAGRIEKVGLCLWRFVPQHSDTEWCADLPCGELLPEGA